MGKVKQLLMDEEEKFYDEAFTEGQILGKNVWNKICRKFPNLSDTEKRNNYFNIMLEGMNN